MKRIAMPSAGPRLASCVASLSLLATAAVAHSPVESTRPSDGATLASAPEELLVTFARPARVVKMVMTHTGAGGASETRLELPKAFVTDLRLTPELPGTGDYEVLWRAMGEDGHVLEGTFAFEVR